MSLNDVMRVANHKAIVQPVTNVESGLDLTTAARSGRLPISKVVIRPQTADLMYSFDAGGPYAKVLAGVPRDIGGVLYSSKKTLYMVSADVTDSVEVETWS